MTDVKIICPACSSNRYLEEIEYDTEKQIRIICPACDGKGYTIHSLFVADSEEKSSSAMEEVTD